MADGQALHVVAVSRPGQQDLGQPGAQRRNPSLVQSSGRPPSNSGRQRRPDADALGAFYRRLAARIGKAQAVTATARKLAVLFYKALRFGMTYADPGVSAYEARYRHHLVQHLERRAKSLGFTLVAKAG